MEWVQALKAVWVKHYGWPEVLVHDQGPEFMGRECQNLAGTAGVLTMPIDSQSPWQNGKTDRAGQSFKRQLWDMDETSWSLKRQSLSVVTRETVIVIGLGFLLINARVDPVCVCQVFC